MRADKAFYIATLTLVLLGAFALALSGRALGFALATIPVCVVNGYWHFGRKRVYLPDWLATVICIITLGVTLLSVGGAGTHLADLYTNVPSAGKLLLVVQWVMLFRRKAPRDYAWIYMLSFMMLVCTALMVPEIEFAAVFILMLIVALCAMSLLHVKWETERAGLPIEGGRGRPARRVGRRFVLGHGAVALVVLLPTVLIFVVLPRDRPRRLPISLQPIHAANPVVGFSETVELGAIGTVLDNPTRVMNVEVYVNGEKAGAEYVPLMRGLAFDQYNGRRWISTGSSLRGEVSSVYDDDFKWHLEEEGGDRVRCEVMLEPLNTRILFAPFAVQTIRLRSRRSSSPFRVNKKADSVELIRIYPHRVAYTSESLVVPPEQRQRLGATDRPSVYLSRPPQGIPGRVRRLALEIAPPGQYRSDLEVARRIESHLFNTYAYTLNAPTVPATRDPIDFFLFESKAGYCEHYASAMVILLRCRNIPARLVAGFKGGVYNDIGGYFVFRQSDAHSWVEAYVRPYGWVTFDPTGPSESQRNPPTRRFKGLSDLFDYVRTAWIRHVVAYDYITQSQVFRRVRDLWSQVTTLLRRLVYHIQPGEKPGTWAVRVNFVGIAVLLAGTAIAVLFFFHMLRRPKRRRAPRASVAFYRKMERLFARRGLPRDPSVTPREFAREVAKGFPACAKSVRRLTERFCDVRYGGRSLTADEERALLAQVRSLRRAAAGHARV